MQKEIQAGNSIYSNTLIEILNKGGVAVIPTDTIYGLVGKSNNKDAIARIYKIKGRSPEKKLINLISAWEDVKDFGIDISRYKIPEFNEPTTYIIEGTSFRIPKNTQLKELIKTTGALVAPSANPEGLPPAKNIYEAKGYFATEVDIYIDGGNLEGKASKIIKVGKEGAFEIIRE
jgi:L-threonylcarbamoyladenylate synthase